MDEPYTGDVQREVKSAPEVVVDGVEKDVEDGSCGWTRGGGGGEKRGTLAAKADREWGGGVKEVFAQRWVFDYDSESCEVEKAVECGTRRAVGVVEDIGCEGEKGAKRGFGLGVGLRGAGHELIAEELIGVCEIVRAQEYGGLRLRSFLPVSTSLELRGFLLLTVRQTALWRLRYLQQVSQI